MEDDDKPCFECHAEKAPRVDVKAYEASVHAGETCTACHEEHDRRHDAGPDSDQRVARLHDLAPPAHWKATPVPALHARFQAPDVRTEGHATFAEDT